MKKPLAPLGFILLSCIIQLIAVTVSLLFINLLLDAYHPDQAKPIQFSESLQQPNAIGQDSQQMQVTNPPYIHLLERLGIPESLQVVLIHGSIAALLSYGLRLPFGWRMFNILMPLAVWAEAPSTLGSPVLLILTVLIFLPTLWTRIPFYPTHPNLVEAIAKFIPEKGHFNFVDIGSGFGGVNLSLAKQRPHGRFVGIELALLPCLVAKLRSLFTPQSKNWLGSFWHHNLDRFDLIYAFLSPVAMEQLWEKVQQEMKPGALLLVNSFPVPGVKPEKVIKVEGTTQILYAYRKNVKGKKPN